jgi:DNA-binding NarL/FixJ family response regulator
MTGGTLVISRAKMLYPNIKRHFEKAGFNNVNITGLEREALNIKIDELKPKIILIDSDFNQAATPFNVGIIHNRFPKYNIAAVAYNNYPLTIAAWFIWYGAKSCLHLWADGSDEFNRGLQAIKNGKEYISPIIKSILDLFPEWPKTKCNVTNRQFESLILLCCGMKPEDVADEMYITRKTIDKYFAAMFEVFHVHSQEELISRAWVSGLVNKEDLKFYRKEKELKLPEWAIIKQRTNEKLQKIYEKVYGN